MLHVEACYQNYDPKVLTVGTSEVAFPAVTSSIHGKPEKIFVQSWSQNTGRIFVGKTGIATDGTTGGYELLPGSSFLLPGHMVADWVARATAAGQKLFITYLSKAY